MAREWNRNVSVSDVLRARLHSGGDAAVRPRTPGDAMSRATRTLAERFPIRFRTRRGHKIHAGRPIRWNDLTLIEAACGGVMPPREGAEDLVTTTADLTCASCSRRIARSLSRSEILAIDMLDERARNGPRAEGPC